MTRQEFTDRTNYTPSWSEFETIHSNYMEFDGDKDQFCRMWKKVNAAVIKKQVAIKEEIEELTHMVNSYTYSAWTETNLGNWRMADYFFGKANEYNKKIKELCEI